MTPLLFDEFKRAEGYERFVEIAQWTGATQRGAETQMDLIELTAEFCMQGTTDITPTLPEATPYEEGDGRPPMDMDILLSGQRVRNIDAFKMFYGIFLGACNDAVRSHVMDCMLQVFSMSPANYYIVQQQHVLAMFLEMIDSLSDEVCLCLLSLSLSHSVTLSLLVSTFAYLNSVFPLAK